MEEMAGKLEQRVRQVQQVEVEEATLLKLAHLLVMSGQEL